MRFLTIFGKMLQRKSLGCYGQQSEPPDPEMCGGQNKMFDASRWKKT